jgi:hypothetical protein
MFELQLQSEEFKNEKDNHNNCTISNNQHAGNGWWSQNVTWWV